MSDKDRHKEALERFRYFSEVDAHNRQTGLEDLRFAREGRQWDQRIEKERRDEGRPMLTINRLNSFTRQVINDCRQNKPSIKVHPVDDNADVETAEVISDLIRQIEYASDADVAYDTAVDHAVNCGFGYIRVTADYAYDDSFDQELRIQRIRNPFSVYRDPDSQAADSSDWNACFVTDRYTVAQFEKEWGKKREPIDWEDNNSWGGDLWREGQNLIIAEYWTRDEVERKVVLLDNGSVIAEDDLEKDDDLQALLAVGALKVKAQRLAKSCKVTQSIMSGAEILETNEWKGRYIPIIPVYGDEFDIEGKVYYRSLIHDAIDTQRMYNYWRTTATELVALAPRVPFIGPVGAFTTDSARWSTVNRQNHPFVEYDVIPGAGPPQRQPLDSGPAAGALQQALTASDDMKAIMGLYDASLGQRSNETSGKAIMARQREGDTSTFHFVDNMRRAIRHTGRVILDLLPHYYNTARILRVRGADDSQREVAINQPAPKLDPETGKPMQDENGQAVMAMHDLTVGKYDLTVSSGPSYTTKRMESADQMMQLIQAFPAAAQVMGDLVAKNLDWPGADEIADRLKLLLPPQLQGKGDEQQGIPPEVQQMIQQAQQAMAALQKENEALKSGQAIDAANLQQQASKDEKTLEIQGYDAETRRIAALANAARAVTPPPITSADLPQ